MTTWLHNRTGTTSDVRVKAYGTKTTEPFLVLAVKVGHGHEVTEVVTSDPTSFFAQVDNAKAAWHARKGATP